MDYDKLIDRLNTKLQSYASYTDSEFAHVIEDAAFAIETLRADLARVTAERDGAMEQLRGYCPTCKNYTPNHNEGPCAGCKHEYSKYQNIDAKDNWEWRGIKEED